MDADLQYPPEVLIDLIGRWRQGMRSCTPSGGDARTES